MAVYIDRPPRLQPELPVGEYEIPNPPDRDEGKHARLIQIGLPLLSIIGYVLVSMLGSGGRSPLLLIPMALSVVASTAFSIYSFRKEKQDEAAKQRSYAARLVELNKEMHTYHDLQRRFYGYNYPDSAMTLRIVRNARAEAENPQRALRSEARVWERRTSDDDFGVVRLGMGTLPSTVTYVLGDVEDFDNPQVREAMKLAADSRFVPDIPVIISLRQPPESEEVAEDDKEEKEETSRTPQTHALGIAGERDAVYAFTRSLLADYAVYHAPMDARLYVLASEKREWDWTNDLPHSKQDEQNRFRCFVDAIKATSGEPAFDDDDGGEIEQFLEGIRKVLSQRKIRMQERDENRGANDPTLPFLLVVVDLLSATYDPNSPLRGIESDAAISILLAEGAMLGAAVIFLVPERSKVPGGCRSVIEIEKTTAATNARIEQQQKLHFRYAEVGVNSFRYVGQADAIPTGQTMNEMAKELATINIRQSSGANLASAVPFFDLMNYTTLQELHDDAWKKWDYSIEQKYANWLRVKIGLMSGNKPRTLVFSAKRDGVHGMVAGSTGSGKSELLISLITAMAVTYDPTVLNFVLVDYKGGGAFAEFKNLPHCVDIITNLAREGVTRMFTAIRSEMARRQVMNTLTGTKNIVEYRQKGLHLTDKPYPFLFIIIDEFAEMIADRAEYKAELEMITRLGRAQGISLILAAQRPTGVTDQMRSNIKFRISLRVETDGESREMLRRSDAAYLPTGVPGRGYLQVGNEEIDLIQVAYTGDRHYKLDAPAANVANPAANEPIANVIWPERGGSSTAAQDSEPPELYKAIIDRLRDMARAKGVEKQRAPWPEFLPRQIALSERLVYNNPEDPAEKAITYDKYLVEVDYVLLGQKRPAELTLNPAINQWLNGESGWVETLDWAQYAMRPVVGLIDNPYAAKQSPLLVNFPRGHAVVFGASGWGKTTFIRTLIVSLAATHSPNHFHTYVLDLGGRSLTALKELPHLGALIIPDEEGYKERVEQLLRELDDMIERRKTLLNDARLPDIYEYNRLNPATPQPAIVVAVDNFLEFVETFGEQRDDVESTLDRFIALARQSKSYGIHFIISVSQLATLSNQLYSLFTERFTLKLADPTEYRPIVGGHVDDISDIPGRGYTKLDHEPLSFQVAVPIDLRRAGQTEDANEIRELERLAQYMKDYMARSGRVWTQLVRVDSLPKAILFKQLLARQHKLDVDPLFAERLKATTRQQWAESASAEHADWLKVTLGVMSGNRPRTLHMEAKKDGVHGMIAGGTGAGKSELLMTLIIGLALNYDPTILNFVLVDYKGGGAFTPFVGLPHCVDMVTNLNKAAVKRMFTAVTAEMERRQKLNADTGTSNIVEYRQKGKHLDPKFGPYPHLFIIIDEYAEMINDNPEYKDELDRITRLGRAQGVNLLLAAQRPTGVSDQMRANIKFRICLRVEGIDSSREMLRRSDAAFLPSGMPGRGYVQVGNDNIELIQVAYTGENYDHAPLLANGEKPKFYDVVVNMANELLDERERPRTPWPPFLAKAITLADPLLPMYLDQASRPLITLGQTKPLSLNPFVQDWLDGVGTWHGTDWDKTTMRAVVGLLDDPYKARQLPLVVDFTKGHAVLFGAAGWGKTTFMRSLIVSLASTHSPDEFQAHVLDLGGRNLEVLRELPHVGTVIMPDERGYEERVQQLWRELNEEVDQRKQQFSKAGVSTLYEYNSSNIEPRIPALLVIIDNFTEYIESFGDATQKKDDESNLLEAFISLARQGKAYGLHFMISVNRLNVLSSKLYSLFTERLTLRLSDGGDYGAIVGSGVSEIEEIAGRGFTKVGRMPLGFQVAVLPGTVDAQGQIRGEANQIKAIAEQMHEFMRRSAHRYQTPLSIDALPKSSSYRQVIADLFKVNQNETAFLDDLRSATTRTWQHNGSAEHADWLAVPLGITSGNRLRTLHFEAKKDGVHGMIAGGTGSGKSELLMTMIVGLALHYSPSTLNFVLVDYKGGGAFKPFERMPHCVDIVTNLNKAAVERMFTAISAEIRRRQGLNAETATKDIVEYRQKGLQFTREPYPYLFIIIDEYSEMISENDEYRNQLDSITRVGRAQGINLILASQQPKGVSDQMRANIKLRLCLRVEQMDTSRELLRRPDAALLPNGLPGRGYMQIGNENLELVQVSWTGENQPDTREAHVLWPNHQVVVDVQITETEVPKFYDAVVTMAGELNNGQMAPKPWPGFLPENFTLESVLRDAQHNRSFILQETITDWRNGDVLDVWPSAKWDNTTLNPIVGLLDDPAEARQEPLRFDLKRNHLAVFGDAGMGKTTLLRTLLLCLAATHSPNEFHAYVLDLGGRNFRGLEGLPHVGAVIYGDEETFEERLGRLLETLERITEERQRILSNAGVGNLADFNARFADAALPAIIVMIDNMAELQENYGGIVETTILSLVRRSLSVGITFVIASNVPNNMPSKLYNLLGERVTFKQANLDRYMDVVGRGAIEIGDTPGRGYIRKDRRPLLFHVAQPVGIFNEDGRALHPEADELKRIIDHMHSELARRGAYTKPEPIRVLEQLVTLSTVLQDAGAIQERRFQAVLGYNAKLQPALFDLKRLGPHFMIAGPPLSGKTTTLHTWVLSLALRYKPTQVAFVLIDLGRRFAEYGGKHSLGDLPHVLATICEPEQLNDLAANLKNEGERLANQEMSREIFVVIDNFDDFSAEIERVNRDLNRDLAILARRYGRDGLHFIISNTLAGRDTSDLKRQIQAANFGIGLRTAEAMQVVGVGRTPPGMRDKELPVGRGYVVKSGQATMIQIATPYALNGHAPVADDPEADEEQVVMALDHWVEQIRALHPHERATWSNAPAQPVAAQTNGNGNGNGAPPSAKITGMLGLLQRGSAKELARLKAGTDTDASITEQLMRLDLTSWHDESILTKLLKQLLIKEKIASGLPKDLIDVLYGTMEGEDLLRELSSTLPVEEPASV